MRIGGFLNYELRQDRCVEPDANSLRAHKLYLFVSVPGLCLILFWSRMISPLLLLALWGNKNWPPSMKVKKMENFQNKRGLKDCKWSSLDAPGTENPLSHPLLGLEEFSFPNIGPVG